RTPGKDPFFRLLRLGLVVALRHAITERRRRDLEASRPSASLDENASSTCCHKKGSGNLRVPSTHSDAAPHPPPQVDAWLHPTQKSGSVRLYSFTAALVTIAAGSTSSSSTSLAPSIAEPWSVQWRSRPSGPSANSWLDVPIAHTPNSSGASSST